MMVRRHLGADSFPGHPYEQMPQANVISHSEVARFVRDRRFHGRGVGWIDVHLLASALVDGLALWTADPRCAAVAEELAIGYEPGKS